MIHQEMGHCWAQAGKVLSVSCRDKQGAAALILVACSAGAHCMQQPEPLLRRLQQKRKTSGSMLQAPTQLKQ